MYDNSPLMFFEGRPFTRSDGSAAGWAANKISKLVRDGFVRRLVRGVYVDTLAPDSLELRAAAIARVAPPTSPLATAVHLGRHLERPFALSAIDAMLHAGLIQHGELCEAIERYPRHPGIARAREMAELAEPLTESPGESWLRLRVVDAAFRALLTNRRRRGEVTG